LTHSQFIHSVFIIKILEYASDLPRIKKQPQHECFHKNDQSMIVVLDSVCDFGGMPDLQIFITFSAGFHCFFNLRGCEKTQKNKQPL
jgi:hypothetical protein